MANPFEQFDSEKEPVNPFAQFDDEQPPPPGPGPSNIPEQFKERLRRGEVGTDEPNPVIKALLGDKKPNTLLGQAVLEPLNTAAGFIQGAIRGAQNPLKAFQGEFMSTDPETGMPSAESAERAMETGQFGLGSTIFKRARPGMNGPVHEPIGTLPQDADFKAAAESMAPERIVGAAVTATNGEIFSAPNHLLAREAAAHKLGVDPDEIWGHLEPDVGRFLTSKGRMVDRTEAGQMVGEAGPLFAENLASIEQNLRDLWEDKGIHPAEAVNDAQNDAFLRGNLTSAELAAPPGMTRLYRGETASAVDTPVADWIRETPEFKATVEATGRWFGPSRESAEYYVKQHGEPGNKITYVDVPTADVQKYLSANQPPEIQKFSAAGREGEEYFLPKEIAASRQELTSTGADVTRSENLPSLEEQPLPQVGTITAAARDALDQLGGLARNIQYALDPMSTGSQKAMVIAKDAMNSVRRIQWDHVRIDNEITRRFDIESRTRMWNGADEESVALQLGESREHQGLATLTRDERNMVELLHGEAQEAWLQAVDTGMVSGDGLPAYTPRMVLGIAAAGERLGPRALNELGRNVFTRTSQMLHRKHMMAEETVTAAKEMVRKEMTKRGASEQEIEAALESVKIARDIRALPLATARLKEAAIWKDMINKIKETGRSTGADTVADFNPGGWFTIEGNPAFTEWQPDYAPNPVTGAIEARVDDAGNTIFRPKQLYMHPDFKGPMHAILDESSAAMKVVPGAPSLYGALMAIKGKSMTAILNSPLIHNEVVWSKVAEAAGGRDWLGFGLYFKGNRIVNGHPARAHELIDAGLNPTGPRGSYQDITAMMEEPNQVPGRSWTAKVLGAVPGLFDDGAEIAVRQAVDKMGDFWHNTLLWDRVRDVQFGLADHLSDRLVAKGSDRLSADRIGSHLSNIIVGSIPKEAMSAGARAVANVFLFSRSFTLGNLSTFKAATLGLPKPILAQIERDFGMSAEAAVGPEAAGLAAKLATGIARRKALSTIALSAGLYYVGNALLQNALNITMRDSSVDEEWQGYARRYADLMKDASSDPWELRHLIGRLSPTYDNEPRKQDRAHVGYAADGTAYYARNPMGKFGEEMVGYPTMPLEMLKRKLSPGAGGMLEILENDKGFGRKIYDENDTSVRGLAATAFAVAKHLVMKHLPEGQINAAVDLLRGDGDADVNKLRVFGPAAGFTVSEGAPGGMAKGELYAEKAQKEAKFSIAWPDIKKQILRGDTEGAKAAMSQIQLSPREQTQLIRAANNPARISGRALLNFIQSATPAQLERFNRARANAPALAPQ